MTSTNSPKKPIGPWEGVGVVAVLALILIGVIAAIVAILKWGLS